MTNHWIDLRNSDCIFIIGSNAAENHPVSFKWVMEAKKRGAKLISVDPRFTRTSAKADIYAPLRSGTDIAFIGGIINYCLRNKLYNREYVAEFTNASHLINEGFAFNDGFFSGFDRTTQTYNKATWQYQVDENGIPKEDKTLQDPHCVFQLLKNHYARYDADMVSRVTGCPQELFLEIAKTYCETGKPEKSGTIMYAMGATQHTYGTQNVRSYAILQLLLGNMGVAGGGINALRGESNVQGSTDHCLLFHILPGYLKVVTAGDVDLATYLKRCTPVSKDPKSVNYWKNYPKFFISLMKSFFGDNATKENDFGFGWLPKTNGNYSHIRLFEAMERGDIKGFIVMGQNPAVGGPNANLERLAMKNLDWMVTADLWDTETSSFWMGPGMDPKKIKTEVFRLPAVASFEKEGSISNSGRWAQWRYKAAEPPGDAKDDLWILSNIYLKVQDLYKKRGGKFTEPIVNCHWPYGEHPDPHMVAKEINGYDLTTGKLLVNFTKLVDDGSTSSGNWLYSGSYTEDGNMMARRGLEDPTGIGLYPNWTWCWPVNRRIIYNRASCDIKGKPWSPKKPVIQWDGTQWVGDVPDYGKTSPPENNVGAFIMKTEGHARIFGMDLADGPFPEHYEPIESPITNPISSVQNDPVAVAMVCESECNKIGGCEEFPIVATTYRVTELWQAGQMTRNLTWLVELMPSMFVEMSKSLAKQKGISNGDKVKIWNSRGEIEAYALVTDRFQPFKLDGKMVDQIGLTWHFGYVGVGKGASANCLTPHAGDANTLIPEFKAFLCNLRKA
jgi:formate dehydrogenase-N alpha subunit